MNIIQPAFDGTNKLLKGALHVHTTRSDGQGTPQEVLTRYKENGYDFVALTDHNIYNTQNFAPETDLLIIPGTERNNNLSKRYEHGGHTFHTVCLGGVGERKNLWKHDRRFTNPDVADQSEFQPYLGAFHDAGQITFLCHPEWSGTAVDEFDKLEGHFAMEIFNTGCAIENAQDENARYWDEILTRGKRWFGVAVDDGHPMYQHGKGWVCVNAAKDVNSVLDALTRGAFYSSTGPVIHSFRIEDGLCVLECSPCQYAGFVMFRIPTRLNRDYVNMNVTRAETTIPEGMKYIRGICKDKEGRLAWTNPIFLD